MRKFLVFLFFLFIFGKSYSKFDSSGNPLLTYRYNFHCFANVLGANYNIHSVISQDKHMLVVLKSGDSLNTDFATAVYLDSSLNVIWSKIIRVSASQLYGDP